MVVNGDGHPWGWSSLGVVFISDSELEMIIGGDGGQW